MDPESGRNDYNLTGQVKTANKTKPDFTSIDGLHTP